VLDVLDDLADFAAHNAQPEVAAELAQARARVAGRLAGPQTD